MNNSVIVGCKFLIFFIFESPGITRLNGNKKGVFTRNRQPKAVAQMLRMRYFDLAMEIDDLGEQPSDLDEYISPIQEKYHRIEL